MAPPESWTLVDTRYHYWNGERAFPDFDGKLWIRPPYAR